MLQGASTTRPATQQHSMQHGKRIQMVKSAWKVARRVVITTQLGPTHSASSLMCYTMVSELCCDARFLG
jgi:hypothetical protein